MRPPKYPLEPLVDLRDNRVDKAAGQLAIAARQRDATRRNRIAFEQKSEAHAVGVQKVRVTEASSLMRGELYVEDLARADAWEVRVAADRDALASALDRARDDEARACVLEDEARAAVATSTADAQVVARDRSRWWGTSRKRSEAKEEEASSEAWRPSKS